MMLFAGRIFFALLSSLLWVACAQKTPAFEASGDLLLHKQSGVELPKNFPQWNFLPDSLQENISPEIFLGESFEFSDEKLDVKPQASIFILRVASSSNLKLIENRVTPALEKLKFLKTETVKLKGKKKVLLSTYSHSVALAQAVGSGAKSVKSIQRLSYFATQEKGAKTVAWVTISKDKKAQQDLAMDFIERALFAGTLPDEKTLFKKPSKP
jgi:hypothetical protein